MYALLCVYVFLFYVSGRHELNVYANVFLFFCIFFFPTTNMILSYRVLFSFVFVLHSICFLFSAGFICTFVLLSSLKDCVSVWFAIIHLPYYSTVQSIVRISPRSCDDDSCCFKRGTCFAFYSIDVAIVL